MPIYEFACPKCRVIFNFLSQRVSPDRLPVCPKCGNKKMEKQMSSFATPRGTSYLAAPGDSGAESERPMPDFDNPRMMRAMNEMERDMAHLDENKSQAHGPAYAQMKGLMPPGSMPKEMDIAIKRLEAGEDPENLRAGAVDKFLAI